ncbi:MAG TPA: hypothetical protein VKW06_22815 [Candidatus Angelobacter sp.]|nr:hypothetical protein [Candidatus Angelobacter sp.]
MRSLLCGLIMLLPLATSVPGAAAEHTVVLGSWRVVRSVADSGETHDLKVRRLLVDGKVREYTVGPAHDVTDRIFVVQRVYRVNDALPNDPHGPQWIWRLDGWISVDRTTGRISQLSLPAFDPDVSQASWYRDYAAYCGVSEENQGLLVVSQIGKRKPILRKEFASPGCALPKWDRGPMRVTFTVAGEKTVVTVRPHGADLQSESSDEEGPK